MIRFQELNEDAHSRYFVQNILILFYTGSSNLSPRPSHYLGETFLVSCWLTNSKLLYIAGVSGGGCLRWAADPPCCLLRDDEDDGFGICSSSARSSSNGRFTKKKIGPFVHPDGVGNVCPSMIHWAGWMACLRIEFTERRLLFAVMISWEVVFRKCIEDSGDTASFSISRAQFFILFFSPDLH